MNDDLVLTVSDFVAVFNQTLEYAYPSVTVVGELANFRVSKNRWVYFDLKDELASVKFFGTVYGLPGPLEDGLMLQVRGTPRLHPQYGFSITFQAIQPVGEGSLRRAAALLEAKLAAEGLFDAERKRPLPYPPQTIGLIASKESAAYHDFIKILNERWGGVDIRLADVQVQGEAAPGQIIAALDYFNTSEDMPDVLVVTRGGGSPEDLAAFNTEQVTRAVAVSRIPTLVAIGHEIDISLAELAADQRASTPSNAAQLLVPDKVQVLQRLSQMQLQLGQLLESRVAAEQNIVETYQQSLDLSIDRLLKQRSQSLRLKRQILEAFNPESALKRGYAIARHKGSVIRSGKRLKAGDELELQVADAHIDTTVNRIRIDI
jgi:exodeoxyribonuclease VII large subunit